jgi:DNA repair protein RadC
MLLKALGSKAISIIAAMELGRRRRTEDALEFTKVTSSKVVFEIMQPIIGSYP